MRGYDSGVNVENGISPALFKGIIMDNKPTENFLSKYKNMLKEKGLFGTLRDVTVNSQVWKSIFRHTFADTPKNRMLKIVSNVFMHLHPAKVKGMLLN